MNPLIGLVVKAYAWRVEDPGFNSHLLCKDFSRSSHTSDLKISTPVAALLQVGVLSAYCDWLR